MRQHLWGPSLLHWPWSWAGVLGCHTGILEVHLGTMLRNCDPKAVYRVGSGLWELSPWIQRRWGGCKSWSVRIPLWYSDHQTIGEIAMRSSVPAVFEAWLLHTLYVWWAEEGESKTADVALNDRENIKRITAKMWSLMMFARADDRANTRRENCWWMVYGIDDQAKWMLAVIRKATR